MKNFEISRWNSDDQAVAILENAHFNRYVEEPKFSGRNGEQSAKHKKYCGAMGTIRRAINHLSSHTPEFRTKGN